jgi:hypothetical protein
MRRFGNRRDFLQQTGLSAAGMALVGNLNSLGWAASTGKKKRLVFVFSPNGVIPDHFWPDAAGPHGQLKRILQPLACLQDRLITLKGVCNRIQGDGDGHMRGIGCLLTGIELFPGDVQGGSDTPAGWSKGISVDSIGIRRPQPARHPDRQSLPDVPKALRGTKE